MRQLFLYDPEGWLQRHWRELEKKLTAALGGSSTGSDSLVVHMGWPPVLGDTPCESPTQKPASNASRQRRCPKAGAGSQVEQGGQRQRVRLPLEVVLLSAADAIWPLATAAQATPATSGKNPCSPVVAANLVPPAAIAAGRRVHWDELGLEGMGEHISSSACPAPLVVASQAAPVVALEAFGLPRRSADPNSIAAKLAGPHGPWAGSQRHLEQGALRCGRLSLELSGFQSSIAKEVAGFRPIVGSHPEPLNEWPLQSTFRPRASLETRVTYVESAAGGLDAALAAPAELRARLGQAAGPLATTEPELVLVSWLHERSYRFKWICSASGLAVLNLGGNIESWCRTREGAT